MKKECYLIKGMTCASCSSAVERVTRKMDGVKESQVNLATNRMTIEYDEEKLKPEDIIAKVERAGFGAELEIPEEIKKEKEEEKLESEHTHHEMKKRLIFSICFALPLLYISMGHMLPFTLPLPEF